MKRFGLIGVGGFIAPRHLEAIKNTGSNLEASVDRHDSVGIIDSYFPKSEFFLSIDDFSEYIELNSKKNKKLDYISICSPNYLHFEHIKFALERGISVICEKPLVLNTAELELIKELEKKSNSKVNTILQLRLHPDIIKFKKNLTTNRYSVDLTYITSRGSWYQKSWKGDPKLSGGVMANIGVHFFDMLNYLFGSVIDSKLYFQDPETACGFIALDNADVNWFLSVNETFLPSKAVEQNLRTYRSIEVEESGIVQEIEFSKGFADLHTKSYINIIQGNGFESSSSYEAIKIIENIDDKNIHIPERKPHYLYEQLL